MKPASHQKAFLLFLPLLLIPTTALLFFTLSRWLNPELGYVLDFLFYWTVWCFLVPLFILKKDGVVSLFKEESPLFRRSNWLPTAVLILIIVITGVMYPPTSLLAVPATLLSIAIPVAIINGVCEELL